MLKSNFVYLVSVSLPLVMACADAPVEDDLAGELSSEGEAAGKADGSDTFTFFSLRADTRRCSAPACGGFFVERVNREATRCADGRLRDRCYVPALDAAGTGLTESDLAPMRDRAYQAGAVIVRGEIVPQRYEGFGNLGRLDVTEVWLAGAATGAPEGVGVLVEQTGIRCIAAPCADKLERKLNSHRYAHIADLDFAPSGAGEDEIAAAWDALTIEGGGGMIVFGDRYWVEDNGNVERARTANQFYTRLAAAEETGCRPTGCSGQVCADQDVITTCEYRDEYACYQSATCERQADGACGWTQTEELAACLADPPGPAMTVEECEAAGAVVRPDIGDGQVRCLEGETELGDVLVGVEGGKCCAPASPAQN